MADSLRRTTCTGSLHTRFRFTSLSTSGDNELGTIDFADARKEILYLGEMISIMSLSLISIINPNRTSQGRTRRVAQLLKKEV